MSAQTFAAPAQARYAAGMLNETSVRTSACQHYYTMLSELSANDVGAQIISDSGIIPRYDYI
jgi:hypothetical protein